ncbi:MAG: PASTA domain-containing protein [Myxococcales bacterium]|nr:PASTA domain-containing protein [Myxococcales bacterium]
MKSSRDPRSLVARLGSPSAIRAGRRHASARATERQQGRSIPTTIGALSSSAKAKKSRPKKKKAQKPNEDKARQGVLRGKRNWPLSWKVPIPRFAERIDALPPSLKVRLISTTFIFLAVVIAGRAMQLQLIDGERYRLRAVGQGTTERTISGKRGRILDRHRVELANSVDSESVYAERDKLHNHKRTSKILSSILGISQARLAKRFKGRGFVYLARRVSPAVAQAVRDADLKGIGLGFEPRRTYGNIRLAAHILGFVDIDGVGRWGIERTMQRELEGRDTRVLSITDALRRAVWLEGFDTKPVRGNDVVLTIDRQVQFVAEEVLERTVKAQKAQAGVAIVLDSPTGEVLALASYPSFNPNNLSGSNSNDWRNRGVEIIYDPGSTSKIVTLAAALELEHVSLGTLIDCEDGEWNIGNRRIRDANHSFGLLTAEEVFYRSSNIGAGKIGLLVGKKNLHLFLRKFGFGRRTGIELPAESAGILRPSSRWYDVDLVNISFGQGLSVTPLQVIQAANVIANDGLLVPPSIVLQISGRDSSSSKDFVSQRAISVRTARAVKHAMTKVTAPGGTALRASVPGFVVAGKTGTAQKFDPQIRAYSREKYVASFVGFVPAESPKVTVLVLIDEPKEAIYGGPVAGPAFREIAIAALASKELYAAEPVAEAWLDPISRHSTVRDDPKAEQRGNPELALERAVTELTAEVGVSRLTGFDPPLTRALSDEARALLGEALPRKGRPRQRRTARGKIMPDLRGFSLGQALDKCAALAMEPIISGTGKVYQQKPRPGVRVGAKDKCALELRHDS